jgi:hypothetical protein
MERGRVKTPTKLRRIKRWVNEDVLDRMQDRLDRMPEAMDVRRQTVEQSRTCWAYRRLSATPGFASLFRFYDSSPRSCVLRCLGMLLDLTLRAQSLDVVLDLHPF